MRAFSQNLILLAGLFLILYLMFPQVINQVVALFGGVGILVPFIILVILSALPARKKRR